MSTFPVRRLAVLVTALGLGVAPATAQDGRARANGAPPPEGEQYMRAAPSGGEQYMRAVPTRPRPEGEKPSDVTCLSARDARGAIRSNRAVPLAQAARVARSAWDGEVIDYRLCSYDGALAYELTLLNDGGKVARARVDAGSGKLLGVR